MKIESLKEKARNHEQNEEWGKALDLYLKAIGDLADDEQGQPDIGLYNRAGDLQTRIGEVEAAVDHYERAVDLYLEADLPNNAIAICKKVLRNLPDRASMFLRMGQIRADQGFLVDARQNFLKYAELQQHAGKMDEAFRALIEFADLAPDDVEIRMAVAQQLEASDRIEEAVEQYIKAHQQLTVKGQDDEAGGVAEKIEELAPGTAIPEPEAAVGGGAGRTTDLPGFETTSYHLEEEGEAEEAEEEEEIEADFGEIELGGAEEEEEEEEEEIEAEVEVEELEGFDIAADDEDEAEVELEQPEELPTTEFGDEEEEADELPMMEFGDEDDEEAAEELPMMDFGDEDDDEEAEALPMMDFGEDDAVEDVEAEDREEDEEESELTAEAFGESGHRDTPEEFVEPAEEMPELEVGLEDLGASEEADEEEAPGALEEAAEEAAFTAEAEELEEVEEDDRALADAGDFEGALRAVRGRLRAEPDDLGHHQRRVEYAHRTGDDSQLIPAYLDLAGALDRQGAGQKARAVLQQVLELDPGNEEAKARLDQAAESDSAYVDLGSMVLDEEKPTGETRWVVPAQEPTGDEEADFASMLSQFKQKVSENVAQDDLTAHYDLGTAYKEMGLMDEAISEFQQALRTDAEHLPTYEMLGQCFMEQGEYEVAIRSLSKAANVPSAIEDDLIGIYYYLGRAHQEAGNSDQAREFYEKVFSLDINFRDVTERLRALR